jgi:hypothetical protein
MAFKIKDLMISITAPVNAKCTYSDGCIEREKADVGCVAGEKSNGGDLQPEGRPPIGCPGHHTDVVGCVVDNTGVVGCPGRHTDAAGCPGQYTDVVICVGKHTEIVICLGKETRLGNDPEPRKYLQCGRCTERSPKQGVSAECDPGEMLGELNIIKAQLQAELAEVDGEIRQIEDTLQPKTIGEVEELQTKLQEALDELGKIKAEIEKK